MGEGPPSERSLRYTTEAEQQQLKLVEDAFFSRVADFSTLYEVFLEQGSAR